MDFSCCKGGLRSTGLEDFVQQIPAETNIYENTVSFLALFTKKKLLYIIYVAVSSACQITF
jgi:hypothetical protein